ncbi:hypothetical protein [Alkalilimnicola sp. S0819]|uniref:hypothetical protein n=1 Tax=Alkalilimnicola sp. S0819 TaxID=2613922 RepID=UPI00126165EF|nr:hypothetical protein [Alkalilimnicola sp. S0819]KAB7624128.1 hypothetical protein F3N43_06995 [Alkalilimnicola sp. S0819]MPQ16381.1 hypothetical protein [Alkalilimnicola sp. S0819]
MDAELLQLIAAQGEAIQALLASAQHQNELRLWRFGLLSLLSTTFGAVLAYSIGSLTRRKAARAASAKAFLKMLAKFEAQCLEYWSKEYEKGVSLAEEAKIKAGHKQIRQYAQHGKLGLSHEEKEALFRLVSELFDEATGGDFESSKRKPSRLRMQRVANISAKMAPILIARSFH